MLNCCRIWSAVIKLDVASETIHAYFPLPSAAVSVATSVSALLDLTAILNASSGGSSSWLAPSSLNQPRNESKIP